MKFALLALSCLVLSGSVALAKARRAGPERAPPEPRSAPPGSRSAPPEPGSAPDSITIFEGRKVMLALPRGFTIEVNNDPRGVAGAQIVDWQGRVSLQLTFLPDPDGRFAAAFAQKELMHRSYQDYLQGSVEGAMQFEALEPKIGRGTYCVFTDKRLAGRAELPPNDFLNATVGVKAWPGVVMLFTVLSNGTGTQEYRAVMTLLRESLHERIAPLR